MQNHTLYEYYELTAEDLGEVNILKSRFNRYLMLIKYKMYSSEEEKELTLVMLKGIRKQIVNH
jgi:hypothetical protein